MKSRQNLAKKDDLKKILDLLQDSPNGLSLTDVSTVLKKSTRSLLRRMNLLLKEGKVQRTGRGPSTLYLLKSGRFKPGSYRSKSIGYNLDFLEKYIPNKTYFLEKKIRQSLFDLGQRRGDTSQIETFANQIYQRLLIDLSWSSSKLEGNTYSLLETEKLLQEQQQAQGKDQIETQMILNHKEAVSFIIRNQKEIGLNTMTIRNIHALLSDGLLANPADSGKLRDLPVGIDGTSYIPLNNPQMLEEQFHLFVKKLNTITDAFEQSLFAMVYIPYLQPFIDLNKRTSRVVCNIPFVKNKLSPLSFNETNRDSYIQALIAIYEENDFSFLKNLFIAAYTSSAERYQLTKNSLVSPNPLKVKYRYFIRDGISSLLKQIKNQVSDLDFSQIKDTDREGLARIIESELNGLHEGNFAKYDVLPSEYRLWEKKFAPKKTKR